MSFHYNHNRWVRQFAYVADRPVRQRMLQYSVTPEDVALSQRDSQMPFGTWRGQPFDRGSTPK